MFDYAEISLIARPGEPSEEARFREEYERSKAAARRKDEPETAADRTDVELLIARNIVRAGRFWRLA